MTETEQPKEPTAAEKLKAHVREFGATSLVEHWIDSLGDGAQQLLDKIKGNKPSVAPADTGAPTATARTKQNAAAAKQSAEEE